MDADNQDEKPFSLRLTRYSGIQMSPQRDARFFAPQSREKPVAASLPAAVRPIVCGIPESICPK